MFRQQSQVSAPQKLICPECKGTRFVYKSGSVTCTNCNHTIKGAASNKYGAKRTEFNGTKYDSKYEAGVAQELELRKLGNDIKDYDKQYKVEIWCYRENGLKAFKVSHKVDFRVHHNDGSFELLEAKGIETADYQWRRKFLEEIWLPEHLDHTYTVIKQRG